MTTATYQPGSSGIDLTISSGDETGHGSDPYLSLNNNQKILIKFDISDISSSMVCNSATMSLYTYSSSSMNGKVYTVYAIKSGNSSWNESATWNTRNGTNNWAGSAGCSTSGTDFDSVSIGSCTMSDSWLYNNQFSLTPSVVKTWFGASNSNYGMVIRNSDISSGFMYSSDEATYTAYRPKLVVVYSAAGVTYRRTFQPMGLRAGSRRES